MIKKNSKYTIAINMPINQYEIHKMEIFSDGFSRHRRFDIYVREVPYTDEFPYQCNIDEWYRAKCSISYLIRLNSSPPSVAYMRQWIRSALVQIMSCRLFGAKPLSKPMLGYFFIGPLGTNFSEISIKIQLFSFTKMHLKILSVKWGPFCPGGGGGGWGGAGISSLSIPFAWLKYAMNKIHQYWVWDVPFISF